jgi:hypothetical protein
MAENYLSLLEEAKKHLKTADHMMYITFPILKENRLLIKILEEICNSMLDTVNAVLQYESLMKRIKMYKDQSMNFEIFRQKCAMRYNILPEQINRIIEILGIAEKHRQSPLEFSRKDRFFIMSDNLRLETVGIDKLKSFLIVGKDVLTKVSLSINKQF